MKEWKPLGTRKHIEQNESWSKLARDAKQLEPKNLLRSSTISL